MSIMHLQFLCLLAVISLARASQMMPRFDLERSSKIMLTWDDNWLVGGSNMLAILSDGKKIGIRVRVVGDIGSGMKRLLHYKCPKSSAVETLDLSSLESTTSTDRCPETIAFKITAVSGSDEDYLLTMGSSRLLYLDVFNQRVELFVRVEYETGTLQSNRLFVWSLDAISSFSSSSSGSSYNRRFLTDTAVSFMKTMTDGSGDFSSIQFLDPAISRVIKDAPPFFRAKMNLGSILYFDAGSCLTFQMGKSVMFVNYNSKLDGENQKFQKLMKLNIEDGKLWFSTCGLKQEVRRFYDEKKPATSIGICTIVSFSGEVEPYQKTEAVQQRVPIAGVNYPTCPNSGKKCQVVSGTNSDVTILSGMDFTAIVCPIVCNDKTEVFRFYHDGRQLIGNVEDEWTYFGGVRISKTGNIVEFPPTLSSTHSGLYRCEAGDATFSFDVKVISLPQFETDSYTSGSRIRSNGLLPPKVFAMEGETLSYSCAVYFASLGTVQVRPVFYFATTEGSTVSWKELSLEAFMLKVGTDAANFRLETLDSKDKKNLTATVLRVPPQRQSHGTNFTHRFVCDVSIAQSESMKVGMPTYTVQSGGDVMFVPRLTRQRIVVNPSNNCSVQTCAFGKGAFFEFALSSEFMAYLRHIGVEVVSYFKLDNDLLSDVKILFNTNDTEVLTEGTPGRLAYRIYPVSNRAVATELTKRRLLTPVYNFRYKEGADLNNMQLDKQKHGAANPGLGKLDCRADHLCFYSTDFDMNSTLSFLPVALTFSFPVDPEPVTSANAMIIGIVIAVICLIIGIILIVYFARREPERAYFVEEKEIQLGHDPKAEAKAEVFKEYQRVANPQGEEGETAPLQGNRMSLGSSLSVVSGDDKELDQYKEDIDFKDFGEQGSFIGGYQNDPRKKEVFSTAQGAEATV